jgi:hypothetical protein
VADTSRNNQQILVVKIGPPRFSSPDTVTRHKGRQSLGGRCHATERSFFADLIDKLDEHIVVVSAAGWCRQALHHAVS